MRNNDFDKLYFDYFTNTSSYVKTILDLLPNDKEIARDKSIVKEIYNYIMNTASDSKKSEVLYVSAMFNDKLSLLSKEEAYRHAEYLYNYFIKNMIYDSINRPKYFDIMNECVKVLVGFYSEKQNIVMDYNGNVRIEKGHYR